MIVNSPLTAAYDIGSWSTSRVARDARHPLSSVAVVLLLFAAGHQLGFRNVDPRWNADTTVAAMRNVRFPIQGFQRTYWEFFSGFGFFVTTLLLFSAYFA